MTKLFDVHPHLITTWKVQLQEGGAGVFGAGSAAEAVSTINLKLPHAEIGELMLEMDFWSGALEPRPAC